MGTQRTNRQGSLWVQGLTANTEQAQSSSVQDQLPNSMINYQAGRWVDPAQVLLCCEWFRYPVGQDMAWSMSNARVMVRLVFLAGVIGRRFCDGRTGVRGNTG